MEHERRKIWKTGETRIRITTKITTIITTITITGTIATRKINSKQNCLRIKANTKHAKCVLCIVNMNIRLVTCIKNLYT